MKFAPSSAQWLLSRVGSFGIGSVVASGIVEWATSGNHME